jgi:ADP-ribosyl-[dinitrogen reductase] hydrolase
MTNDGISSVSENRAKGVLLGLACGDALGRPVEFKSSATIETEYGTLDRMIGNGTHRKPAGTITDDTDLAMCIARSLVDCRDFNPEDIAERFVAWYESDPFDIGSMTSDSLRRIRDGESWDDAGYQVWKERPEGQNAGNGSVMRCVPYAIAFADNEEKLGYVSEASSAITHADPRCRRGCAVLNLTIACLLRGNENPLESALSVTYPNKTGAEELAEVLETVPDEIDERNLSNTGYVVDTVQAAFYYALDSDSAREAIIRAVNAGGDADTVGAVTGAIVGARFGADSLPEEWLNEIDEVTELEELAEELTKLPEKAAPDDSSGVFTLHGHTIDGSTSIFSGEHYEGGGHRPYPYPGIHIDQPRVAYDKENATFFDWEARAGRVHSDTHTGGRKIPVPEYSIADSFEDLPEQDQKRIEQAYKDALGNFHTIEELCQQLHGDLNDIPLEDAYPGHLHSAARIAVVAASLNYDPDDIDLSQDFEDQVFRVTSDAVEIRESVAAYRDLLRQREDFEPDEGHIQIIRELTGTIQLTLDALRICATRHPKTNYEEWERLVHGDR